MTKTKEGKQFYESRKEVLGKDRWKLEKMYKNLAQWGEHYAKTLKMIAPLKKFKGQLKSPKKLLEYFIQSYATLRQIEKLYVYASHLSSVDLSNHHAQIISQKAQDLYSEFSQAVSFQGPELVKLPTEVLKKLATDKKFHEYHKELKLTLLKKKHILSDGEEQLISLFSKTSSGPNDIFSALDDVDLVFSDIKDGKGKSHRLSSGNFTKHLESTDRTLRQNAFEGLYTEYKGHIHTYSQTLNLAIKQHLVYTKARKYKNCLEQSLSGNLIEPEVYRTLIKETHKSLPSLHKYFHFRAKKLGLKRIRMWDLRVPIGKAASLKFSYEEAVDLCLAAVRPLGEEYVKILAAGLRGGWVDKYENKGKRGGAFSGGCYDSDPYILMNFTGTLNDVYTLIHEAGHSMHSYYARHNQPYGLADYALFTAEIASTVNERLLTRHLLTKFSGAKKELVLAYEIDAIRATYYRQTMFAEFELNIHSMLEEQKPLTSEYFNKEYARLNAKYHGDALEQDDFIQYEWARIPHFYYNFYVYQYATGIAAAYYFVDKILAEGTGATESEKYLAFLKSGGDNFPLKQLKKAGLYFTKPDLYRAVAKYLEKCLNLL